MKLEVGKSYRNRLGDIVTIISQNEHDKYPFSCKDNEYTTDGNFYADKLEVVWDLIEELSDEKVVSSSSYSITPIASFQTISLQEQMDKVLQLEKQLQEAKKQLREML